MTGALARGEPVTPKPLTCCGGIYQHKSTCANHRHVKGGMNCPKCRDLS